MTLYIVLGSSPETYTEGCCTNVLGRLDEDVMLVTYVITKLSAIGFQCMIAHQDDTVTLMLFTAPTKQNI